MSHTDHYIDVTIEKIMDALRKQCRNPSLEKVPYPDGGGYWNVLYFDALKTDSLHDHDTIIRLGVEIEQDEKTGFVHTDKGCFNCWNGQSVLADVIKNELYVDVCYVD